MENEGIKKIKIVIIGGSIAGLSAATRARRVSENSEITIIEDSEIVGIPLSALQSYASGEITKIQSLHMGNEEKIIDIYNIKILKKHSAKEINREEKEISVKNITTGTLINVKYDKLILATGNTPILTKILKRKLSNVFMLRNINDATAIREYISKTSPRLITIIGASYLGITTAVSFLKKGFDVTIIDKKPFLLNIFDEEFSSLIREELYNSGITIFLNSNIKEYIKNDRERISKIKLTTGLELKTHMILCFPQEKPNIELASKAGLEIGEVGRIKVNEMLQTSDPDIFAIGNISETFNYVSKNIENEYLYGSQTQIQGRLAGTVSSGLNISYKGTLQTKLLVLKNMTVGITGISEKTAKNNGFDIMPVTIFTGSHERFIPGAQHLHLKIIVNKLNRKILGAQIAGKGEGVDKNLDILATAIYSLLTVDDLINLDLGYSPGISTAKNPINLLGMVAVDRLDGLSNAVNSEDIDIYDNILIVDVRNKKEYLKSHIEKSIWIPLNELRSRIDEIPKDKKIYVYGNVGLQGFIAERILKGFGYENVFNIQGGITSIKIAEKI